jgi:hypothetical protein
MDVFILKCLRNACLCGKKHFNLLILGSLPTGRFFPRKVAYPNHKDFSLIIPGPFLAENPLKFPNDTYDSHKKHHNFSRNIDVLSENPCEKPCKNSCIANISSTIYLSHHPPFPPLHLPNKAFLLLD